jgi:hypothetical protein
MPSHRTREDASMKERIRWSHLGLRGIYGAPRVQAALYDEGVHAGRK